MRKPRRSRRRPPSHDRPRLQALLPFGLESNTSEEPVINNAQFVPQAGLGQRQIGLVARGEFFTQYDFGYAYRQALLAVALGLPARTSRGARQRRP